MPPNEDTGNNPASAATPGTPFAKMCYRHSNEFARKFLGAAFLLIAASTAPRTWSAEEGTIVVPNSAETRNGTSSAGIIYNQQLQQIFSAAAFASVPTDQLLITALAFRWDERAPSTSVVIPAIGISMSTFRGSMQQLNSNPVRNRGTDRLTTFSANNLTFQSRPPTSPHDFEARFTFSTPFLYDRTAGQLVLDVGFGGIDGSQQLVFDYDVDAADTAQIRWITGTAGGVLPEGWVVQFSYISIPEPNSICIVITGLAILALGKRGSSNAFMRLPGIVRSNV